MHEAMKKTLMMMTKKVALSVPGLSCKAQ